MTQQNNTELYEIIENSIWSLWRYHKCSTA